MSRMVRRREFIGKAASATMVPFLMGKGMGIAQGNHSYSSPGLPEGMSKGIMIGEKYEVPTFSKEEFKRRWQALQRLMTSQQIDSLLILSPPDLRYVANLANGRTEEYYCLLPQKGDPSLFIPWGELYCYMTDISPVPEIVNAGIAAVVKKIKDLGLEKSTLGVASLQEIRHNTYASLQKELPEASFVEASEIMVTCCRVRSEPEIAFFRKSQEIGEKAFSAMVNAAKPGVTDKEVLSACVGTLISAGADMNTMIMYNHSHWPNPRPDTTHFAYPYHTGTTERKLQKGDIVGFELYSSYGGYYSDICLPISIGKPSPDYVERFELSKGMIRVARDLLRPGSTQADLDAKLSEYVYSQLKRKIDIYTDFKNMVPFPRSMEDTKVRVIQPGMVFVLAPTSFWDRGPNHCCGETYLTTEGAAERLGSLPTEIAVV